MFFADDFMSGHARVGELICNKKNLPLTQLCTMNNTHATVTIDIVS